MSPTDVAFLAATLIGWALAILRLLDAWRPLWAWLPKPVQPVLPALVTALPLLVGGLEGVSTPLEFLAAFGSPVAAFLIAWRGGPPTGGAARPALLCFALLVVGCSGSPPPAPTEQGPDAGAVQEFCVAFLVERVQLAEPDARRACRAGSRAVLCLTGAAERHPDEFRRALEARDFAAMLPLLDPACLTGIVMGSSSAGAPGT